MNKKRQLPVKKTVLRGRAAHELGDLEAKHADQPTMPELYRRAEVQLRKHRKDKQSKPRTSKTPTDPQRLLHELQVHQVELEMQNVELQESRNRTETLLDKYTDLYDFAPVGYFTLTAGGDIQLVNLTGASLVGLARSRLVGQPFARLVAMPQRPAFNAFLKQVFASQTKHAFEFELVRPGQPPRIVNIEAERLLKAPECRVAMVDITARTQSEVKVRVSEVRFRRLFEAAHDGVLILDPATRKITDANPFMTKLLGYSHDQLLGKELFEIGLLKDEAASREVFQKLKRTHEVRYEDLPLESQTGRHQEVEMVANQYDENGHAVIQCSIRDITQRKAAELTANRLAAIVAFSDDAIIGKDTTGIITSWNKGAEKVFGYTDREMVGTSTLRLIPADRQEEEQHILAKIRRGESMEHFETVRKTKGGRLINVSITASPIRDATGKVVGVSKVARDISGRKQAEEMSRRNEALFSALVAQAPVGVYVVDAQFRLQQVNAVARPLFSRVHPFLGRDLSSVIHVLWPKRVADRIVKRFRHTLKTGAPYQSAEFTERRQDSGTLEVYEWQIQRVTLPAGEYGVVCFFSDITKRKQAEETQRRLAVVTASNRKLESEIVRRQAVEQALQASEREQRELLKQSQQMQAQLRQLSHQMLHAQEEERKRISRELHDEIAQILAGINVHLAALSLVNVDQPGLFRQQMARTQQLVEKSVDIVHRFARELRPSALDHLGLIPALHSLMNEFMERSGTFGRLTAFATVEPLDIEMRTILYRVAHEALNNVARHAHASRVEVSIEKQAGRICMIIKDDGKAFDVEHTLRANRGRRLGLLGMRERLEMVGGSFSIESAPGKGTTIRAQIPVGKPARGAASRG